MTKLNIMPDLPIDNIRLNNNNENQIILDEKFFIKKMRVTECDSEVLASLCNLNIEGYNNHKKIFIDENGMFIYLMAPYLKEYKDVSQEILTMSSKEILELFRLILERLIPAHQEGFNPFDIRYSNYLLDKNNQPIFTNFALCYYKEKGTYGLAEPNFDFEKQKSLRDNLVIHDKMEILRLFLQSISSSFDLDKYSKNGIIDSYELLKYFYANLKKKFIISKDVEEYLDDLIFKKMLPKENDYFIESLIKPLEKGLELKR